jgi:hypothetical protein
VSVLHPVCEKGGRKFSAMCEDCSTVYIICTTWHAVTKHSAMKEKSAEENKLLRRRHYTIDLKRNRTVWLVVRGGGEASLQVFSDDVTVYSPPRLFHSV